MKKIAIPSNDGKTISGHFGRALGFVIVELYGTNIVANNYKQNDFTGHARGNHHNHQHGEGHNHGEHGNQAHSHHGIFQALNGVDAVIAGGMGQRLWDEFMQQNIEVYMTRESDIENAVKLYIEGKIEVNNEGCCVH